MTSELTVRQSEVGIFLPPDIVLENARTAARHRDNPFRERSYNWRGGRSVSEGYIRVMIYPENPYYLTGNKTEGLGRRILEHRLVMSQYLGRPLFNTELVHHKNGIKDDNRIKNLELMPSLSNHTKMMTCSKCELRKEIRLLRWEIKELRASLQLKLREEIK